MSLSEQQEKFCREYVVDLNATAAAERAGYSKPNKQGPRLLTNVGIQERVKELVRPHLDACNVTTQAIIRELARVAFSDCRKLFKPDGSLKRPDEWDDDTAATLASVEVDELWEGRGEDRRQKGLSRKVRRWDKVKALELLGKYLGMFIDRHELVNPARLEIEEIVDAPASDGPTNNPPVASAARSA